MSENVLASHYSCMESPPLNTESLTVPTIGEAFLGTNGHLPHSVHWHNPCRVLDAQLVLQPAAAVIEYHRKH